MENNAANRTRICEAADLLTKATTLLGELANADVAMATNPTDVAVCEAYESAYGTMGLLYALVVDMRKAPDAV